MVHGRMRGGRACRVWHGLAIAGGCVRGVSIRGLGDLARTPHLAKDLFFKTVTLTQGSQLRLSYDEASLAREITGTCTYRYVYLIDSGK